MLYKSRFVQYKKLFLYDLGQKSFYKLFSHLRFFGIKVGKGAVLKILAPNILGVKKKPPS
jgi:hypothetical protein